MAKIKFWSSSNIRLGFKLLGTDILTAITMMLPLWLAFYLIKTQEMVVLGAIVGIGLFFFNYHIKGWWARILGVR